MGASCATGSKTTDPDKEPYGPSEKTKKGKGKGEQKKTDHPSEAVGGGREDAKTGEDQGRPPSQNQEEQDGRRKTVESSRSLRTNDEDEDDAKKDPRQKRSSRGSSSADGAPSRPPSTEKKKRDSHEVPAATVGPSEEQPRPRKRTPKEGGIPQETRQNDPGENQPEAAPRSRRHAPEVTSSSSSGPDVTKRKREPKPTEVEEKVERKRSSLDNEFIVPVKLEAKVRGDDVTKREPKERVKNDGSLSKEERPEKSLQRPDIIQDSVVEMKVKVDPKLRSAAGDRKEEEIRQKSLLTAEPGPLRGEGLGIGRETQLGEIKLEEIEVGESPGRPSVPAEVPKQGGVGVGYSEPASPRRKTVPGEFEITSSGLTPRSAATDAAQHTSRSSVKDAEENRKSGGSRRIPSPAKQQPVVVETMAVFGALRGLSAQRPPDVVSAKEQGSISTASPAETAPGPVDSSSSTGSHQPPPTKPAHSTASLPVLPATASINSVQNSRTKDPVTEQSTKLQPSPETSPSKPVPASRTTIAKQSEMEQTDASNAKHEDKIIANGIDSPTIASENDFKPKPDRSSKLPVKGSSTSTPISSPSVSTSDSVSLSPVSPTASSLPPSTTKRSDSTRRRESNRLTIISADEIEQTKSLFPVLSKDTESLMDSRALYPGTRGKLLQAVDKWLAAANEKERENTSRVMVVSGRPGIGKTCLATEVCRRHSSQLVGAHFFQFHPRRLDQNLGRTMMMSISAKMTDVIPGYDEFLPTFTELRQLLDDGELSALFSSLIARPLQSLKTDQRYLIVIDGLDECCQQDRDVLLQLIGGFEQKTPGCAYLFCTVRDDNQLTGYLDQQRIQSIELKGSSEAMTADIKRFLRDPMSRLIDRISLDGALNELSKHSQGTFLAAYLLKRKLEGLPDGAKLALRDVAVFPSGFEDICKEYFQRFYDHLSKKYPGKETAAVYGGVVGILALAKEHLSPEFLKQVHAGLEAGVDLEPLRGLLDVDETGAVGLHHKSISEWLMSDQTAAPLAVTPGSARQRMSDVVLVWLGSVLEVSTSNNSTASHVPTELVNYALKHALEHLTDAPKNQDSIAGLLCSLSFVERKLKVPGVSLDDLLSDYRHSHYQVTGAAAGKLITLEAYMKRSAELVQQIEAYATFVRRRGDQISRHPGLLLQFAANYSTVPRIQQNAQNDLLERPWLEDMTSNPDTSFTCLQVSGVITKSDLSNDSRSVAILTQHEQSTFLHLLNAVTGEYTGDPIEMSSIPDCRGQCVRFLPDNNHLFVGSLSTFVSLKTWKPITSALDVPSLQTKENFVIECCDAAANTLAFGINTLPWNGRTLYLGLFDLKTKKAKLLEVHSFRFGGSSQFGIKALGLSQDGSLVATCVKHQKKVELKATVWNTATSKQLHTVDLENDSLTRCFFVGNQSLVISGGSATPDSHQLTYLWPLQDKKARLLPNANADNTSVAYVRGTQLTLVHRCRMSSQFVVSRWRKEAGKQKSPDDRLLMRGTERLGDLVVTEKSLVFLSRKSVQIYHFADMSADEIRLTSGSFALNNSVVEGLGFFPRSDDPVVVHGSGKASSDEDGGLPDTVAVSRVSIKNDGVMTSTEFLAPEKLEHRNKGDETKEIRCFQGEQTALSICSCTSDGSMVVINYGGSDVRVLDVASGAKRSIPKLADVAKEQGSAASRMTCVLSTKEPLVAVMYSEKPQSLFIFDLRAKVLEPSVELKSESPMSDFAFIPTNGHVVTYHRNPDQSLGVWNQRTGASVSTQTGLDIVCVRQSPSSDRMALSLRPPKPGSDGSLVLRNSDNRFNMSLSLPQGSRWVPRVGYGDVEFSADGTVLLGMFPEARVLRLWNIGNGEILKDLEYTFTGPTSEIIGMVTNSHAIVSDGWMLAAVDVSSGEIVAAYGSTDRLCPKGSGRGLRISPKGALVAGSTEGTGELRLIRCHGLASVKRKTTLQLFRNK